MGRAAMIQRRCATMMRGLLAGLFIAGGSAASATRYELQPTPTTVAWGHYDPAATPVLRIHSGDTVVFHTLLTSSPTALEKGGLPPDQVEASLREVFEKVPQSA